MDKSALHGDWGSAFMSPDPGLPRPCRSQPVSQLRSSHACTPAREFSFFAFLGSPFLPQGLCMYGSLLGIHIP